MFERTGSLSGQIVHIGAAAASRSESARKIRQQQDARIDVSVGLVDNAAFVVNVIKRWNRTELANNPSKIGSINVL